VNAQIEVHYWRPVCDAHELLPLQAGAKLHVAVDKGSVDYQTLLATTGHHFWSVLNEFRSNTR
jgi:hypothetical protein